MLIDHTMANYSCSTVLRATELHIARALVLLAITASVNLANASSRTSVEFYAFNYLRQSEGFGSFSGVDLNSDDHIDRNELTAFNWHFHGYSMENIPTAFGSYDISTNTWNRYDNQSYFSGYGTDALNNRIQIYANFAYAITTNITSTIPEPESYGMMLSGLAILGFECKRRRRKHNNY